MLYRRLYIVVLFAMLALCSCNMVDIADDGQGSSTVEIRMDWSGVGDNHPGQMYLFASRNSNPLYFAYLYPEMITVGDSLEADMNWPSGEYSIVCFNRRDDLGFAGGGSLNEVSVALPYMESGQVSEAVGEIVDYNEGVPYVGDAGELCYDSVKQSIVDSTEVNEVVLTPKSLVQEVTVRFVLDIEDEVSIGGMKAMLSGVANKVYPATGVVGYGNLCRVILPAQEVSVEGSLHVYEAKVNVIGLFAANSEMDVRGAGILQLVIPMESHLGSRVLYAGINLFNTINEAAPMRVNDDSTGYCISTNAFTLDLTEPLAVRTDWANDSNKTDGVDEWFVSENIDVEL